MAKKHRRSKAARPKPFLAAALFCEKVLEEKEGVSSLVRVLDVITVTMPPNLILEKGKPKPVIPVLAFVAFKSGGAKGDCTLQIDMAPPSGKKERIAETTMTFLGEEQGVNVRAELFVPVAVEGLYWYEVRVDGVLFTSMPLRVRHAQTEPPKDSEQKPKSRKGS